MYSPQLQGKVGGRVYTQTYQHTHTHTRLLKHAVEWSDAKGTICCLAIKHHPHTDRAVANVKEIKATANHRQKWWSTRRDPRCTSIQPAHSIWIYAPRWTLQCWPAPEPAVTGTGHAPVSKQSNICLVCRSLFPLTVSGVWSNVQTACWG